MSYAAGTAIEHIELLTDDAGSIVTGADLSDFTAEAYLASTPATTAVVTKAEINEGEYRFTFTPSQAGVWRFHATYDDGVNSPSIFAQSFKVAAAGVSVFASASGYCTLAELRARLKSVTADTSSDAILEACIEASSRAIDGYCARRFYQLTEARYVTATCGDLLEIDDLVSVTSLATDTAGARTYPTTWLTTDYDLLPDNAAGIGFPYTAIGLQPISQQWFPTLRRGVKITGVWGWPAIPAQVHEATLKLAARHAKSASAPFGIEVAADQAAAMRIPIQDRDVKDLLAPYRRFTIGAI